MRFAFLVPLTTALLVQPGQAQEMAPFACKGVFGPETTHERLVAEFGAENVVFGQISDDEATFPEATTVFPQDPAKRISITWRDGEKREGPRMVLIGEGSGRSLGGVKAGMSVDEVEALNGRPFLLGGFNDIDRGRVAGWNGGQIDTDLPGCDISISFGYRAFGMPLTLNDPLEAEGPYLSSEPAYQALGATVTQIIAYFPTDN